MFFYSENKILFGLPPKKRRMGTNGREHGYTYIFDVVKLQSYLFIEIYYSII